MPNTELPMDLESQVVLMKKYITFRQRKNDERISWLCRLFQSKPLWKIFF